MIRGRDIVITGLQGWDSDIGSNSVNIAQEFARDNRVLFVNYPLDRLTRWRRRNEPRIKKRIDILKGREPALEKVAENIWNLNPTVILESINQLGPKPLFNYLNKVNNRRYARTISKTIDELGFKDIILFDDSDMYRSFYLKELLNTHTFIYYIRDNMIATDYYRKHGARMDSALIRKADVVVTNSVYLANYAGRFNQHSYAVGQGCDLELFNPETVTKLPDDIKQIPSPRIGYMGSLRSIRLDIEKLKYAATQKTDWNFVFVGPEDNDFKQSKLHGMKNVYFLGAKQEEWLPAYVAAFDVAINPQKVNEITIGNYPRKVDEYLAMGKPVVATRTDAMIPFNEYTYQTENKEDFIQKIGQALKENNPKLEQQRKKFAETHTWENNVKAIYEAVERVWNKSKNE
ncbi:MAG: glycosyltransferase [Bacteroidales bacterium]|nr:glycosyltransferase [Bacteroidales bacterium]